MLLNDSQRHLMIEGWVITSGTFTPSARTLAQANGVKLIDGYALRSGSLG
jgi:hypothetical protein